MSALSNATRVQRLYRCVSRPAPARDRVFFPTRAIGHPPTFPPRAPSRRHSLKTMLSWAVQRDIFYTERDRIRAQFYGNAHLRDLGVVEKAIADGEAKLEEYAHPDPYTVPTAYGGSKYARNPPPHPDVKVVMDFGREEHVIPR
jgi:NADH dehydrogenase (ubiquinone) 1 beta subcomplex subunit 9